MPTREESWGMNTQTLLSSHPVGVTFGWIQWDIRGKPLRQCMHGWQRVESRSQEQKEDIQQKWPQQWKKRKRCKQKVVCKWLHLKKLQIKNIQPLGTFWSGLFQQVNGASEFLNNGAAGNWWRHSSLLGTVPCTSRHLASLAPLAQNTRRNSRHYNNELKKKILPTPRHGVVIRLLATTVGARITYFFLPTFF